MLVVIEPLSTRFADKADILPDADGIPNLSFCAGACSAITGRGFQSGYAAFITNHAIVGGFYRPCFHYSAMKAL